MLSTGPRGTGYIAGTMLDWEVGRVYGEGSGDSLDRDDARNVVAW